MSITFVAVVVALSGTLGLWVGAVIAVLVWRFPRGEKLTPLRISRRHGDHSPRWFDRIPLLGWLLVVARCRDCVQPYWRRCVLIEAATALFFGIIAATVTTGQAALWALPAFLYLGAISIALALIDGATHLLPNRIVLPSLAIAVLLLGVASVGTGDGLAMLRALAGGAELCGFYFILAVVSRRGMGMGDVKLAAVVGLYLGWLGWGVLVVGAAAAFVFGGLFALGLIITRRASRRSAIPFGPWMIAGCWFGIFWGPRVWSDYLAAMGLV